MVCWWGFLAIYTYIHPSYGRDECDEFDPRQTDFESVMKNNDACDEYTDCTFLN